jgi:hypothetical protein
MGKGMKLKLVKIIYAYNIEKDCISARQTFVPAGEDEHVDRDTGDEDMTQEMTTISEYSRDEWEDLLYSLRARSQHVVIKNAAEAL